MDLHPIQPVEFDRSNWVINAWSNCVKLGVNPLRLHCLLKALDLNGFTPNLIGQIRPGINYWLNWVEIH